MLLTAFRAGCACLWVVSTVQAAQLKPGTIAAWDEYIQSAESRIQADLRGAVFLWLDSAPDRLRQAREGQVVTQAWNRKNPVSVRDGLIHDWIGALFVAGARLDQILAVMQSYDRHEVVYKPDLLDSHLISHHGNAFQYSRLRRLKKGFLSAVVHTSHDGLYVQIDPHRWYYRSLSTRITQVEDVGKSSQRELPEGNDEGFLWRLNVYWKLLERDGGVYVECEAILLSRAVPVGLGWIVEPVIRALPREALAATLRDTRAAVK